MFTLRGRKSKTPAPLSQVESFLVAHYRNFAQYYGWDPMDPANGWITSFYRELAGYTNYYDVVVQIINRFDPLTYWDDANRATHAQFDRNTPNPLMIAERFGYNLMDADAIKEYVGDVEVSSRAITVYFKDGSLMVRFTACGRELHSRSPHRVQNSHRLLAAMGIEVPLDRLAQPDTLRAHPPLVFHQVDGEWLEKQPPQGM